LSTCGDVSCGDAFGADNANLVIVLRKGEADADEQETGGSRMALRAEQARPRLWWGSCTTLLQALAFRSSIKSEAVKLIGIGLLLLLMVDILHYVVISLRSSVMVAIQIVPKWREKMRPAGDPRSLRAMIGDGRPSRHVIAKGFKERVEEATMSRYTTDK
jgi:hypothetical protein